MFHPSRLSLARTRRRLTARALAELADLTPDTISRLENGQHAPDISSLTKIATALDYPVDFFDGDEIPSVQPDAVSFRSFSKMSAKERDAALGAGALGLQLHQWMSDRFNLPELDIIELRNDNPESAAQALRQHWGLGSKPIGNFIALLEAKGINILSLSEETASVNAFSFWLDNKPFIYLNNFKSAESSIFDTAHELAHLVLHKHAGTMGDRSAEKDADAFASSFLMPEEDIKANITRPISINTILNIKFRWKVSAMALTFRLNQLGYLSEWQYKSFCIELGRLGYRKGEPHGIKRETSAIWSKVLKYLWTQKITRSDIAKDLRLPADEVEGLLWGLVEKSERPNARTLGLVGNSGQTSD